MLFVAVRRAGVLCAGALPAVDFRDPGAVLTTRLRVDAAQVVRLSAGAHASRSRVKLSLLDLPLRRDQLLELIPESLRTNIAREALENGLTSD